MKVDYHKRKLPHIQIENMPNFITFRTHKSIDPYIKKISASDLDVKSKQYAIDTYLDNSSLGAYFFDEAVDVMGEVLLAEDGLAYDLHSFSIMPNHIHIIFQAKDDLARIMQKIKGRSARVLNKKLGMYGTFWAKEYYDKVIRDEAQYKKSVEYVLNNPVKAGLKDAEKRIYDNTGFSL